MIDNNRQSVIHATPSYSPHWLRPVQYFTMYHIKAYITYPTISGFTR